MFQQFISISAAQISTANIICQDLYCFDQSKSFLKQRIKKIWNDTLCHKCQQKSHLHVYDEVC